MNKDAGHTGLSLDDPYLGKKMEDQVTLLMCGNKRCFKGAGRLGAAALCLMIFLLSPPAKAADRAGDEFLTGYVASILERDSGRRETVGNTLRAIDGVQRVAIVVKPWVPMPRNGSISALRPLSLSILVNGG